MVTATAWTSGIEAANGLEGDLGRQFRDVTSSRMLSAVGSISYEHESRSLLGGPAEPLSGRNYSEATAKAIDHGFITWSNPPCSAPPPSSPNDANTLEHGAQVLLKNETL